MMTSSEALFRGLIIMAGVPAKTSQELDGPHTPGDVRDEQRSLSLAERVYQNLGNPGVMELLDRNCNRVLDVGCGAGDNAALLNSMLPRCEVFGITHSAAEADLARKYMVDCLVGDIENEIPAELRDLTFDAILFSHVLEHLRHPATVVARFSPLLRKGGQVIIAVPNVLSAPMRLRFLTGNFEYNPAGGVLDDTHLRFYTYFTADRYLLSSSPDLQLTHKVADGHIPLPLLRGRLIPASVGKRIDRWGCRHWPNLFADQIVLAAVKL
jgi:SAM-dependent methyltransferase